METTINPTVLNLNGIEYVRKDSIVQLNNIEHNTDIKIIILQRGWVYIGRFEKIDNLCRLYNAYNIRIWGTTKGLSELVNGPTSSTKLDKCEGIIEFDWLTVIHTISVNEKKWKL